VDIYLVHTAISRPRFSRYCDACRGDERRAIKLYKANIALSQRMYAVVGMFEIILRNSIDRHFIALRGDTWLEDAVQTGGYLNVSPACEDSLHTVQEALQKLGTDYTHDALISKLTFGFWTYQFAKKQFAASGSSLLEIFPRRPIGTNQKTIFQNLIRINDMRNRIAHYEPLCFDKTTGNVSTALVLNRYKLINELLYWLGYNPKRILLGIDGVPQAISLVNAI
jgi:hypothetical protein